MLIQVQRIKKHEMQTLKIYICCLFFIAPFSHVFAQQIQTGNQNYTLKVSAKEGFKTIADFENAPLDKKISNITYYDGLGRAKQSIAIGASPILSYGTNQLQVDWSVGSGSTPFFEQNGQTTENSRETGTDPKGGQSLLWKCGNDPQSNADGGWNTQYFAIDNTLAYRYSVWVKRTGSQDGNTYHGTQNVQTLDGVAQSNPYFWNGDLPQLNTWYLVVGIIYPYNYTGADQGISGVYDRNGNRVLDGKEFKWSSTTTTSRFRSYLFYSTDTNVRQYFWNPIVQKLDGNQNSIAELDQQQTPQYGDIIAHTQYDGLGRQAKQYLPFTKEGEVGSYRTIDIQKDIDKYYQDKFPEDFPGANIPVNAYAETIFERSPRNRVQETAAPGENWRHIQGEIRYEDPVYTYFPTTISYDKFWEAQDIFYIEGENNLPSQYTEDGLLLLNNRVKLTIKNGVLDISIHTTAPNGGTHKLPLGKIRHIPIASEIKNIDLGVLKDADGNLTDYRLGIQDNYITITPTRSNPRPVSKGIHQMFNNNIIYDLTQIEYVTYQNVYRTKPDSHTIKSESDFNTTNEVLRLDVVMTDGNSQMPTLVVNGAYPAQQLSKNIVKNENWTSADGKNKTAESFTDKNGRTILTRSYNSSSPSSGDLDTYNVYDDFGNLTFVVPSKVNLADGISAVELDELIYQYRYDARNRLIEKKTPGKGWEYIVYNELDQPVLVQDVLLKADNKWVFTKYDLQGRGVYSGIYTDTRDRKALQTEVNNATPLWEERSAASTIDATTIYYSNVAFPTTNIQLHTISYYDDYNFDIPAELANPGTVYNEPITANTKTLPTGSKVLVLETNDWTTTVTYYDKKARAIYAASKNEYLSTTDIVKTQLDFAGSMLQSTATHTKGSNAPIVTVEDYTYDHQGRLLTQTQTINGGAKELLTNNQYDKLGQLKSQKVGGKIASAVSPSTVTGLQSIDYAYNIRGWLKSINNGTTDNGDLFGFAIHYTNPTQNLGATGLYNGNISEITWKTASDPTKGAYGYQYDVLDRLTKATSNNGKYDLSSVTYDTMGNILSLHRKGNTNAEATTFGEMDALAYTYNEGNKLLKVTDAANTNHGFKDGTNTTNDYSYDANGNVLVDHNKNISGIVYNHLDLPVRINVNGGGQNIRYIYDATGTKLKKIVTDPNGRNITEYAGNHVYKNGVLEFFNHSGGIVEKEADGYKYIYQYKDHLGNVRLSYTDRNQDGVVTTNEIVQEQNYYPFGLQQKTANNTITGRSHNFKYNNTELETSFGVNWYEMPLRSYDPTIARWNRIDPVTHFSLSTYNGFDNNPIYYADPSGGNGQSFRGGHAARLQRMRDQYYGSEYSNLDSFVARANSHPPARDNNSGSSGGGGSSGTSYGSGLAGLDSAMESLGFSSVTYALTPAGEDTKYIAYSEELDMLEFGEFAQSYPGKIDFKNVNSKEEFLDHVIEWFGFVNEYGTKLNIHPGSIIDFYAGSEVEPSFGQKVTNFLEDIIGGNSEDHNDVYINDGNGNSVRIGYFSHIANHADIYSGHYVDFQREDARISIRSHQKGAGTPQAIIFMHFTGQNRHFYDQTARRINSYKYQGVKITPYKKL